MKLSIIQLSDIHIRGADDPILSRVSAICAAVERVAILSDETLIICSGDVAFSGTAAQYAAAEVFFSAIIETLRGKLPSPILGMTFVPGNHDCDFASQSDVRELFLTSSIKNVESLDPTGDVVKHCVQLQTAFWVFSSKLAPTPTHPVLFQLERFEKGATSISVNMYNTAWVSTLNEKQGHLVFPLQARPAELLASGDLSISVFHHPYNWLEATNASKFKSMVEGTSDIIMTGHEHVSDQYVKARIDGATAHFIEAAALAGDNGESEFNIITIDLAQQEYRLSTCSWDGSVYQLSRDSAPYRFVRNAIVRTDRLDAKDDFAAYLTDPGAGFTHPLRERVTLDDLFVYPDLKRAPFDAGAPSAGSAELLKSVDVFNFIRDESKIVLTGPDKSGKTVFAKRVYRDLHETHVAVLIGGEAIRDAKAVDAERFRCLVERAFCAQYNVPGPEAFWSIDHNRRALIIDDLHKARLNTRGQAALVELAERFFGKCIFTTGDLHDLEQLTEFDRKQHPFIKYAVLSIQEFGHYLRGKLITKWIRLGRDLTDDEIQIQHAISTAEQTVNTLIGRNLLPSFPIIVLTILQGVEAGKVNHTASGSYGQLYELLITGALSRIIRKPSDLDTKYTYLSRVAHFMFTNRRERLSVDDLGNINRAYYKEYGIEVDTSGVDDLVSAGVLTLLHGSYEFKYPYYYYYFVAKSFQNNIGSNTEVVATRQILRNIANRVYYETYSHILLFYVYLTKDQEIIEHILANAANIFIEYEPSNLESHVEFVNKLYKETPKLILPPTPVDAARDAERQRVDESDSGLARQDPDDADIEYSAQLSEILKAHIAFRTLQLLGQVLRNFPGSLRAELKERITRESYMLGLRVLRSILKVAEANLEILRTYFAELIREHRPLKSDRELAKSTDELLIALTEACAFGLVQRVAHAVGIEELRKTYRDVLEASAGELPIAMIDVAIKLDHFADYPEHEVEQLVKRVHKNAFAYTLLRNLVGHHMYLFEVPYRTRQKMGELLNIQSSSVKMLDNPLKRTKRSE